MNRFSPRRAPLAAAIFLTACAPATPDAGPSAAADGQTQRAAAVACPSTASDGAATSKGRHVPNESDPCADSRGAVAR